MPLRPSSFALQPCFVFRTSNFALSPNRTPAARAHDQTNIHRSKTRVTLKITPKTRVEPCSNQVRACTNEWKVCTNKWNPCRSVHETPAMPTPKWDQSRRSRGVKALKKQLNDTGLPGR